MAAVLLCVMTGLFAAGVGTDQSGFGRHELAEYRLTAREYEKFLDASRRIVVVASRDRSFHTTPLFSQAVAQGEDVVIAAEQLATRLAGHAELAAALATARMPAREYTKFALALIAARLAAGFLDAGLLKQVPAGTAAENVAFVRARQVAVDAVLEELGVEIR